MLEMRDLMSRENSKYVGSGGGSVGIVVTSDTRDPQFKSPHWQNLIYQLYIQNTEQTKIKKKMPGMAHL